MIDENILNSFKGKHVTIYAIDLKTVEDIDDMRQHLINKHGADNVIEKPSHFCTPERNYLKPWLPRMRTGIFNVVAGNYYIDILTSSAKGRLTPRHSYFPLSTLSVKDDRTLVAVVNKRTNGRLEYHLSY